MKSDLDAWLSRPQRDIFIRSRVPEKPAAVLRDHSLADDWGKRSSWYGVGDTPSEALERALREALDELGRLD